MNKGAPQVSVRECNMRHLNKLLGGLVVVIALLGSYGLAYGLMLEDSRPARTRALLTGRPTYRLQGDAVRILFRPAHRLDRALRPQRWPEVPCASDPR
jgi:hypothetical protein